eukprot:12937203-Prorocentrum_lima.AAC.1
MQSPRKAPILHRVKRGGCIPHRCKDGTLERCVCNRIALSFIEGFHHETKMEEQVVDNELA